MITSNVIRRTFQVKYGGKLASCFTIDVDGKQYLCTAKHCLNEFNAEQIKVLHDKKWKNLDVELVGYGSKGADICVLAPKTQLSPSFPLIPSSAGIVISQDVYFLGYPYGIRMEGDNTTGQFPIPLIKRATLSAVLFEGSTALLLDGHNNPGFSGGPVVFRQTGESSREFYVASIVSAYRFAPEPILDNEGKETSFKYHANTGIIISYGIEHALDAIRENPIGFRVKE